METDPLIPACEPMSDQPAVREVPGISFPCRLCMLLLNLIPLAHLATIGVGAWLCPWGVAGRWAIAFGLLFLLPPILARLILWLSPIRNKRIAVNQAAFLTWWSVFNLQVLFTRLPFLEEMLRMLPGAYSAWLRLWGAQIGRLTYWAPGLIILDRPFLQIGNDVVFGAGVRLNPHVLARQANGHMELLLAPISIGDGASIGGYSLLTCGTEIANGELTRAYLISPPFSRWRGGKRIRAEASIKSNDDH